MVVAKNDEAHLFLQKQIQDKSAERKYRAILWGVPSFKRAEIDAPIGRHPNDRKKMTVITDSRRASRNAVTGLTVLEPLGPFSFVEARLQTGRTHQIRVHCAYIGHPVVGDAVYGGIRKVPSEGLKPSDRRQIEEAIDQMHGQALHACSLSFEHPRTGNRMEFEAPMPTYISEFLTLIRHVC
jgi:23S rRNA pseudouridine1911/1915/1917 synthase